LPEIVHALPSYIIDRRSLILPRHIKHKLADQNFHLPGNIEILPGAEIFFRLLEGRNWTLSYDPSLQSTHFGWIVEGKLQIQNSHNLLYKNHTSNSALSLFTSKSAQQHAEEQGKLIVRIPCNKNLLVLGKFRFMALKRFLNLERRLQKYIR